MSDHISPAKARADLAAACACACKAMPHETGELASMPVAVEGLRKTIRSLKEKNGDGVVMLSALKAEFHSLTGVTLSNTKLGFFSLRTLLEGPDMKEHFVLKMYGKHQEKKENWSVEEVQKDACEEVVFATPSRRDNIARRRSWADISEMDDSDAESALAGQSQALDAQSISGVAPSISASQSTPSNAPSTQPADVRESPSRKSQRPTMLKGKTRGKECYTDETPSKVAPPMSNRSGKENRPFKNGQCSNGRGNPRYTDETPARGPARRRSTLTPQTPNGSECGTPSARTFGTPLVPVGMSATPLYQYYLCPALPALVWVPVDTPISPHTPAMAEKNRQPNGQCSQY